jgi:hypothetical protein
MNGTQAMQASNAARKFMLTKGRKACVAIVGLALGLAAPAAAEGFVNTRAGWLALTPEARAAYVQGLNDSLNFIFADDTLVEALAKRGRTRCLIEQGATAAGLAAQMSAAYDEPQYFNSSPVAVYILKLGEVCRPYINRERQEYGLAPQ